MTLVGYVRVDLVRYCDLYEDMGECDGLCTDMVIEGEDDEGSIQDNE